MSLQNSKNLVTDTNVRIHNSKSEVTVAPEIKENCHATSMNLYWHC